MALDVTSTRGCARMEPMSQLPITSDARRASRSIPVLPPATLGGFVVAVLAVALIGWFTYRTLETRQEAVTRVTHTLQVIERLEALQSNVKDAETGQRGYLLTGEERYLEPYTQARAGLTGILQDLRAAVSSNPTQLARIDALEQLARQKLTELEQTITLRRTGFTEEALGIVRTDRGKASMDRFRSIITDAENDERTLLATYQSQWQAAVGLSSLISSGGAILLLVLLTAGALLMSRDYHAREIESWLRAGQAGLNERIQGEHRLDVLGDRVLEFLAHYLNAQAGAVFVREMDGHFRRVAGYAIAPDAAGALRPGDGLLGQAMKENRPLHVTDVPAGYLPVASSLGRGESRELLIAPASIDGVVQGAIELGFLHAIQPADQELLARISDVLGVAVRSSTDRSRLEELLQETQRQSEELQAQQEELRVNNEELEEQAQALKESQARLETQQTELEQTNTHLEEQTQLLERQKDRLTAAQVVLTDKATELEHANTYKSEFLANMSHELRTPLNSSLILSNLLADNKTGNLTDEQVKFAQTISSAGNDLLALINDILDLSKIEAGKVEVSPEPVLVARAVDSVIKTFQAAARQKGVAFGANVEPGTPETIETDPQRLGQILKNLVSNALKFTEKGQVSLRVYAPAAGMIAFAVRDTGIGIPSHQLEIIFEAFRQADGSTHRKYGGTGLGLSISRDLARLLGGDIAVQSVSNEGSQFTLTLPAIGARRVEGAAPARVATVAMSPVPAAQRPIAAVPPLASPAVDDDRDRLTMTESRRILVIEDDPRFAAILRDLARERGFLCVVTHSANDGLAAAAQYLPHAILLDINLPDHSGLGVLDQLKHNPKTRHIPVHIASVADYTQEALERGAIGYALKPVKREQLIDAFRQVEAKLAQSLRRVLVVEDDERQRESLRQLLGNDGVEIVGVETSAEAIAQLRRTTFDCMVMDLNLPEVSGYQLLEQMAEQEEVPFPPVIVYTGRSLSRDEEQRLHRFSKSIIIKDARSPERLLDEVTLFLHQVESALPLERQRMLQAARHRDATLDGRRILVVEDDARNIFALSSVLEPKGVKIEIARNGREAIAALTRGGDAPGGAIDLVLMDIMMPEMDGFTAMREIRKRPEWKKLPIIALTAKAMKDDQERCLAAGANDYIAKPLDVEKLLSLVRVWMPK
jgi:CheY-like chemotaxis protein/signal transduction histidine kinase/CHASE3 domain sensor protein